MSAVVHSPLEVVILCGFANNNGGACAVALSSARRLAELGHAATLFSAIGLVAEELQNVPNLRVVCLGQQEIAKNPRRLQAFATGIWNKRAVNGLRDLLHGKDLENTLVHAHLWRISLRTTCRSA